MHNQSGGAAPVFVDRTGRRRRLTVIVGTAMGLGLLTSLGLILAGLLFDSPVPLPGWSETKARPPIEAGVNGPSRPAEHPRPSPRPEPVIRTTSPLPAPAPTATRTTTTAQPTAQPTVPGPRASVPGRGDERRNSARPSKSPGKP
ncbi:hypothetical protein ACNAW0_08465 [Micromonospora sp. SL1-18]|uniref:hypothetical protein n=1 Tax=Micromonospora sp. SL1-18 TaxID=3399128 RepID=UPI003A4D5D5F